MVSSPGARVLTHGELPCRQERTANDLDVDDNTHDETALPIADEPYDEGEQHRAAPVAIAQRRPVRTAPRRERVALAAVQGGHLRREVVTISVITAIAGVTLAVLKIATDFGR